MELFANPTLQVWGLGIPAALIACSAVLRALGMTGRTKLGSAEADVMSFELVAGFCLTHLAYYGLGVWFHFFGDLDVLATGAYTESTFVRDTILVPMLAYQAWNFVVGLYLPEFGDAASLAHHAVTTGIAFFSMKGPMFQYYAVYFLGCSEISTVPLTIVDIFAKFPRYAAKFPILNTVNRLLFAALFMLSRVIYFPILDYYFWTHCYELHHRGEIREYGPVLFFLAANVFMTGLQFFWGAKMVGFVSNSINGRPPKGEVQKKK